VRATRCLAAARRRFSQRHDDDGIIAVAKPGCAPARTAAARSLQHHRQEKPRLDDAFGANLAAQNEIVALKETARRFQPLRAVGEIVRDRVVVGIHDMELLEYVFVDVRHQCRSEGIMPQLCNSHRSHSRRRQRFQFRRTLRTVLKK
jgi:hypothetical protein